MICVMSRPMNEWMSSSAGRPGFGRGRALDDERAVVVIAEDDDDMRELLSIALRDGGYEVAATRDVKQLLAVLDQLEAPPYAIVSDVRMPGASGLDLLVLLRQRRSTTPVILITGFGDQSLRAHASWLGAAVVFDKPFDIDDLLTALLNLKGSVVPDA